MGLRPKEFFLKMALYSELPVYKATYDLLLAIFRFTKDLGKEYKYTVGESLKKETIELLHTLSRAFPEPVSSSVLHCKERMYREQKAQINV